MSTSYRGASQIVVEFELGTDLDVVTQDVRDMVARARFDLPSQLEPPVVGTFNPNDQPVLWIPLETEVSATVATEVVKRQISPFLETIPGVAGVMIFASRIATFESGSTATRFAHESSRQSTSFERCSASTSSCPRARSRTAASSTR